MPLTEQKIRSFRPELGKKERLFDGRGLYLEVSPTGGTYLRWKYHYGGKERRLAVGGHGRNLFFEMDFNPFLTPGRGRR
jgi:hypothetical protein